MLSVRLDVDDDDDKHVHFLNVCNVLLFKVCFVIFWLFHVPFC